MKKVAINQPNKIISRIKEGFEGVLSIFDGNKYTTSESEPALPEALIRSLENIAERAGRYQYDGIIDLAQTEKNIKPEYTPIEMPKIISTKQQYKETKIDKNKDNELEL